MQVLTCTPPKEKGADDFIQGLAKQPITNCPTTVAQAYGWEHPAGHEDSVVLSVGDFHVSSFVIAKRILPLDVVKQAVEERVALLESQQGYQVPKKDRRRMQDEIHFELLPKAFVQKKRFIVCWQESLNQIYIATNQGAVIDLIGQSLAYCVPGWQLKLKQPQKNVERTLMSWLLGKEAMPKDFAWGDSCLLQDRSNRHCKIRFSGKEVDSEDVRQHVEDGMLMNQVSLVWDEQCRFTLQPDLSISQMKYSEIESDNDDTLSEEERLIAEIHLLGNFYRKMHESILTAFGGLQEHKQNHHVEEMVSEFEIG